MSIFHEKYKDKSDRELQEIVNNPSKFQDDAVIAALDILTQRGIEISPELKAIRIEKGTTADTENRKKKTNELTFGRSLFFAFLIDLIILAIVSYILGFILMFASITDGYVPLIVSTILIIGYFAIGNSKLFDGSTIGKRQMKLKVVNRDKNTINFKHSLLRTILLIGPFFLFKYLTEIEINSNLVNNLTTTLEISYFIALIYFFLLDEKLRRAYPDIILKTYVQNESLSHDYDKFPKKYSVYYSGFILAVLLILMTLSYTSKKNSDINDDDTVEQLQSTLDKNTEVLSQIVEEIQELDNVDRINGLNIKTTNQTRTDFIIDVQTKINPIGDQGDILSGKIYSVMKGKTLYIDQLDNIQIVLRYGFDMTLAKYSVEKTKNYEQ